ncbi:MAG: leucine dehydrogenase [Melioribacteraceae bacterium]|nr:leucine dehydrogenase [Melioribacteraceae bacterium]MCF8353945.1 leucine dehydrogenase [Melioribacteraceae bacterium]MCF8393673.1 leucine dehydrogenase [Melioribacteraceae bacterium]MCF8419585.1 leucine dehydrogenase [Melioribacteraceae bacterium]
MELFERFEEKGHEQVLFCSNKESGLRAIIAIHDTTLGPAVGGARMWNYQTVDEALKDVLRLSRTMTYKASVAGLNFGGGKAVIIGDSSKQKNELLFRTFGKYVDGLAGRYITAEDVGTDVRDMEYVRMETKYVTGISKALGGSGDPSPVTAYGVYVGMKAAAKERWGNDSLRGRKIAIQGAGQVARYLCEHLYSEGAELYIADIRDSQVKRVLETVKAHVVDPNEIYDQKVDIFSPNALGGILNNKTIEKLNCEIVAGGANNQLESENVHGQALLEKNILYIPDYVINAGGLINVANELEGYRQDRAMKQAEAIYEVVRNIIKVSLEQKLPTHAASNKIAEERLINIGKLRNIYSGSSYYSGRLGELARK